MKFLISIISMAFIIIFCTGAYLFWDIKEYANRPVNTEEKNIQIRQGQVFSSVTNMLVNAKIIDNPLKFKLIARFYGYDKKIKAGEYIISSSMSPVKILEMLSKGRVVLYRLTVPEGCSIREISEIIENNGFGNKQEFIELATNPDFANQNILDAHTLEGYLFPDTYLFPKNVDIETIIKTMLKRFNSVFTREWEDRAAELNLSVHQVVTLASIIEKETGTAHERPVIASVFHNRLKKRMRLQSDPTVIYGIQNFDGNITKKHLKTHTPYNTYKINGLPPGPIANPGKQALKAALYPADTAYLYFVSKGDKTHEFSKNLKAHNRAVRKYQYRQYR